MGQDDAITVRKATAEDVLAITELHNSVIEEGLLTWDSPRTEEQTLQWLRYLEDLRYPLLLAVSDGVVVGCAAFEPVWEDTCPGNSFEYSAKLHLLVTKHHRKDGIGSRLFEELCRDQKTLHRKLYRIESCLLSINRAAQTWLLSAGFRHCGSLTRICEKNGTECDLAYFNTFIGPSPPVQGLGFPDSSTPSPYVARSFALPVNLDTVLIRDTTMGDLAAIVGIRNHAVLNSDATAHYVPLEISDRKEWLAKLLSVGWPCLVAVIDDAVVGYACLNAFSEERCFQGVGEISMYLRMDVTRQRIGQQLWKALMKHRIVKTGCIRTIVADVKQNNGPGSGSVLKIGFSPKVAISQAFFKHGQLQGYSLYQYVIENQEAEG